MSRLELSPPPAENRRRGPGWAGVILGVALILAVLAGFIFYQLENLPFRAFDAAGGRMERWAAGVRDAFVAVTGMQPRVTVNEHVVYEQSSPVLELAVLSREASVERETESSWLGSTKHLRLRGQYRIKAGYDLQRPFAVRLDSARAGMVQLKLPRPKLLSVEMMRLDVLNMDNGLWNRVQPEEFEQEVNMLNLEARQKAWQTGVAAEAEKTFVEQIQQKLSDLPPEAVQKR